MEDADNLDAFLQELANAKASAASTSSSSADSTVMMESVLRAMAFSDKMEAMKKTLAQVLREKAQVMSEKAQLQLALEDAQGHARRLQAECDLMCAQPSTAKGAQKRITQLQKQLEESQHKAMHWQQEAARWQKDCQQWKARATRPSWADLTEDANKEKDEEEDEGGPGAEWHSEPHAA